MQPSYRVTVFFRVHSDGQKVQGAAVHYLGENVLHRTSFLLQFRITFALDKRRWICEQDTLNHKLH